MGIPRQDLMGLLLMGCWWAHAWIGAPSHRAIGWLWTRVLRRVRRPRGDCPLLPANGDCPHSGAAVGQEFLEHDAGVRLRLLRDG
jgi:hypothetical protein